MKKSIYILMAVFALVACRRDPDLGELSSDFLVFTNYDTAANFDAFTTYYMPDSIMIIGDKDTPEYWTGNGAETILDTYADNMGTCGYFRVTNKEEADLGLQISYIESVSYFVDYYNSPYWWNAYPGYWWPGYWGNWTDWYYPYPVVYTYSVGSLLTEMVDLTADAETGTERKLPVIWNSFLSGLLSNSSALNIALTVRAVDQSFIQSPYLIQNEE